MHSENENPQQGQQQGNPQPDESPKPDLPMPGRKPAEPERDAGMGRKHGHGGPDRGEVGQDTDGDGKVVQPGQKPGQSGGKGLPEHK